MHLVVGDAQQLLHVLAGAGGDGDDRHPQRPGQARHVDFVPVLEHLVHKVQGDDHGALQLQELGGEVEVALDIGGVDDVDDGVRALAHDEVPGHDFLHGVGGQRVDAGQVHHGDVLAVHLGPALLLLHRHARPVAHVLVGAGEGVEQRGLAAVGVAHQGQLHLTGVVAGVVRLPAVLGHLVGVVGAHAAEHLLVRDMLHHARPAAAVGGEVPRLLAGGHEDLRRVRPAQGQLVAPQVDLNGVAEGGDFPYQNLRAGGQAHVHKPPLDRPALVSHPEDDAALSRRHVLQCHLAALCLRSHSLSIHQFVLVNSPLL